MLVHSMEMNHCRVTRYRPPGNARLQHHHRDNNPPPASKNATPTNTPLMCRSCLTIIWCIHALSELHRENPSPTKQSRPISTSRTWAKIHFLLLTLPTTGIPSLVDLVCRRQPVTELNRGLVLVHSRAHKIPTRLLEISRAAARTKRSTDAAMRTIG